MTKRKQKKSGSLSQSDKLSMGKPMEEITVEKRQVSSENDKVRMAKVEMNHHCEQYSKETQFLDDQIPRRKVQQWGGGRVGGYPTTFWNDRIEYCQNACS